jgi:hypothetical protein
MSVEQMFPGVVVGARVRFSGDPDNYIPTRLTRASNGTVVAPVEDNFEDTGSPESGPYVTGGYYVQVLWDAPTDDTPEEWIGEMLAEDGETMDTYLARYNLAPDIDIRRLEMVDPVDDLVVLTGTMVMF